MPKIPFSSLVHSLLLCALSPLAQAQSVQLVNEKFDFLEVQASLEQGGSKGYFFARLPRHQSWRVACPAGGWIDLNSRTEENDWGSRQLLACKPEATYPLTDAGHPPDPNKQWTVPGQVRWIRTAQGQPVPYQAIMVGDDPEEKDGVDVLFLCRARHAGGVYPGKLHGDRCSIPYRGKEVEKPVYEVAVGDGEWGLAGYRLALAGGGEDSGNSLYVCRVHYVDADGVDRGYQSGKLDSGRCYFGFGGKEIDSVKTFELFYAR